MSSFKDAFLNLPKSHNGFDLICASNLEIESDKNSLIEHFQTVTSGALEEILFSYDNYTHRFMIRVTGRGDDIHFQMEFMKILYDHIGAYSAMILKSKDLPIEDIHITIAKFFLWMEENK